jgi:ubiquinone/menaquinone biosynthesis C-methylase UbiE
MNVYWHKYWNSINIKTTDSQTQVGRTHKRKPVEFGIWDKTVDFIYQNMELSDNSLLLDLCCGNGMLTIPLAKKVKNIVAVDFSKPLLAVLKNQLNKTQNVHLLYGNINAMHPSEFRVNGQHFSHILLYFAIQHFTERETILVFEKAYQCLQARGIFYLGDIPDRTKLWNFANTDEYANIYFESVKNETPAIGTWFLQEDLLKMAHYVGFVHSEIITQPDYQINSGYRFDLKLIK